MTSHTIFRDSSGGLPTSRASLPLAVPGGSVEPLLILIPIYNDWAQVVKLLPDLDSACLRAGLSPVILMVNDGSTDPIPPEIPRMKLKAISDFRLLRLRQNLGHQRAIAIGLAFVADSWPGYSVICMDADGEDTPADAIRLHRQMLTRRKEEIIFAERTIRSEGILFRGCYQIYRTMHFLLTGRKIRFGNFSAIPSLLVAKVAVVPETWSHYAAAVCKARLPFSTIRSARGKRIGGESKLSFIALVMHGLSALSVTGESVGIRVVLLSAGAGALCLGALGSGILPSGVGIPVLLGLFQMMCLGGFYCVLTIQLRASSGLIPIRDYRHFVDEEKSVARPARSHALPSTEESSSPEAFSELTL